MTWVKKLGELESIISILKFLWQIILYLVGPIALGWVAVIFEAIPISIAFTMSSVLAGVIYVVLTTRKSHKGIQPGQLATPQDPIVTLGQQLSIGIGIKNIQPKNRREVGQWEVYAGAWAASTSQVMEKIRPGSGSLLGADSVPIPDDQGQNWKKRYELQNSNLDLMIKALKEFLKSQL